ncbi:N-6 DNA methylase [Desulforhopalus vacuolatus]|uniref:TaqI-like C-terminal specificity domain-containing protein n=1 Tax=Desulforhopalus vacuolatus TaxID=40414 RepID=UPI001963AD19|nr:TaqI-like C-terminal specificity domain-containing protein [Desulforhopalus vacuolatus]MBM9519118.1 N-6 DNA methylase [Desulforhopalus vacuolatus]
MIKVKHLKQRNLFGEIESTTITIEESANRLGVSTATIRNWVKTKYLEQVGKGRVTLESIEQFQSKVSGKEKLTLRANKSLKDSHDHDKTVAIFLKKITSSISSSDKIGIEYEASLSDSYRNKEGIYYTPGQVVSDLLAVTKDDAQDASFCDPCCGSGNFVVRAIELGFKPENIYGYDIDPVAVEITKARIYNITGYKSENIKVTGFLDITANPTSPKFDYIYTNPPWGKKIAKTTRERIALRLGAGSSIDTCSLFFFACLKCLKDGGDLGLLLPESFFNIAIFEDARIKALQLSIERLIDYGKVFKGLVTKAQAIVIRNKVPDYSAGISCTVMDTSYRRSFDSFSCNPKSILNLYCDDEDAFALQHLMSIPYITLEKQASWGLGIVTGNNTKFIKNRPESGYIPVYKGADILRDKLKDPGSFIPSDLNLYQQVAPRQIYEAKEKLIYKFISSRLCFFYDDKQRYVINSANILIPDKAFPVLTKVLGELLSSDFMNWVFSSIFNTHKILRGDLESLPVHSQFLQDVSSFDEARYIEQLNMEKKSNGAYRIKI